MKNILLYFSAFIPMYFLIMLKFIIELFNMNIDLNYFNSCVLAFLSVLIILGGVGLAWNIIWDKEKVYIVTITYSKNITDQHFLGYFSIFILFALSFDLTNMSMFFIFVIIIIFVGIVYVNNNLYYINPFLNILGFNFYEIKYKKENDKKEYEAKMFYRGELVLTNEPCSIKLKNDHFTFINKKKK